MRAWLESLQPRERWILLGGFIAAVAIILWALILRPLVAESATLRSGVAMKQRLLVDIARLESAQPLGSTRNVQGSNQTLVVIINSTAQAHGVMLPRTRPNGPNGIDVTFQGVAFDALVSWLVTLHNDYAIDVESASFSSAREPGLVNGQLSLQRP